jgi:DNA-3-methyladenine glycosylase II
MVPRGQNMTEIIFNKDNPANIKLSASEPRICDLIKSIGDYTLSLRKDYFSSLLRAIIGQQLSVQVARTISVQLCGTIEPHAILAQADEDLRGVGISNRKVSYIKEISRKVILDGLNLNELGQMQDDQIVNLLTSIKGVGQWTAEMFLIFSLGRLDILSVNDMGLRRGVKWLYALNELPGLEEMKQYGEKWRPYRTVASLYLWEAINRGLVKKELS